MKFELTKENINPGVKKSQDIAAGHKTENLIMFLKITIRVYKIDCPS